MEGQPGGDRAHLRFPAVTVLQRFHASQLTSLCFPTRVKRGHSTSVELSVLATCEPTHILEARLTLSPPIFPAIFFLLFLIIFQLEVGQELVLSLRAGLWIYKLIDAGEYNAQATDVITTLIKTTTAAHGFHSWGYVILWQLLHLFLSGCTFVLCLSQCSYKWFFQPECTRIHTVYVDYAQLLQFCHTTNVMSFFSTKSCSRPTTSLLALTQLPLTSSFLVRI